MTTSRQARRRPYRNRFGEGYFPGAVTMTSYDYRRTVRNDHEPTQTEKIIPAPVHIAYGSSRYCNQPLSWQSRLFGMGGTATVFTVIVGAALFTWKTVEHINATAQERLVVMDLAPLAAPPEPVHEVAPGPEQIERQEEQPEPRPDVVVPTPMIQLPVPSRAVSETREEVVEVIDPGPPVPETTAPKTIVAPAASRASNDAQPDWEGQILAHLERFRRYPARAREARKQGTVYIRFKMNRAGMVLSSSIVQKSGSYDLDQAALDTLSRAQPLPAIPSDRPDIIELTIPVEFLLR